MCLLLAPLLAAISFYRCICFLEEDPYNKTDFSFYYRYSLYAVSQNISQYESCVRSTLEMAKLKILCRSFIRARRKGNNGIGSSCVIYCSFYRAIAKT